MRLFDWTADARALRCPPRGCSLPRWLSRRPVEVQAGLSARQEQLMLFLYEYILKYTHYGHRKGQHWYCGLKQSSSIHVTADKQPIRRSSASRQLTISQGSPSWPHDDMDSRLMVYGIWSYMTMIGWWMVIMMTIMKSNFILMIQTMVFWLPGFLTGERGNLQFRDKKKSAKKYEIFQGGRGKEYHCQLTTVATNLLIFTQ